MDCLLSKTLYLGATNNTTMNISSCCRKALVGLCVSNPHEQLDSMRFVSSLISAWSLGILMSFVLALKNRAFTEAFFFFLYPFVSGVTLATGLVYLLPFAFRALDGTCSHPSMRRFPVAGVTATAAVLFTLMVDVLGSVGNIRRKLKAQEPREKGFSPVGQMDVERGESITTEATQEVEDGSKDSIDSTHGGSNSTFKKTDEDLNNGPKGQINVCITSDAKQGVEDGRINTLDSTHGSSNITTVEDINNSSNGDSGDASMIKELSDSEFHQVARKICWFSWPSVIVAVTLGVSRSPCTSWPLFVVLFFRQIFQGLKWISLAPHIQAMNSWKAKLLCLMISMMSIPLITTLGFISSFIFIKSEARALILEGFFNAAIGGVLVYQACANLSCTHYTILKQKGGSSNKTFIQMSSHHLAGMLGIGIMILAKSCARVKI